MRLLVPQIVNGNPVIDAEVVDEFFDKVARVLNGNVGEDNLDPAYQFPLDSFREASGLITMTGVVPTSVNEDNTPGNIVPFDSAGIVLGVVEAATWRLISLSCRFKAASAPTINVYNGNTLIHGPAVATRVPTEKLGTIYPASTDAVWEYEFTGDITLSAAAPSLLRLTSSVVLGAESVATAAVAGGHLT